jgi:hypothetical protein
MRVDCEGSILLIDSSTVDNRMEEPRKNEDSACKSWWARRKIAQSQGFFQDGEVVGLYIAGELSYTRTKARSPLV